jgi:hypothetical protein
MDLDLPFLEREGTIDGLMRTAGFHQFLNESETGLPSAIAERYPFPALLTTPGAGKSRLLHELCASKPIRTAAKRRKVDIVPLLITFNCNSDLQGQPTADTVPHEIAARIVLDAFATRPLDQSLVGMRFAVDAAVRLWLSLRAPNPTRDLVVLLGVDEITRLKVWIETSGWRVRSCDSLLGRQAPDLLQAALSEVSALMRLRFPLRGGFHACILPVLAGVSHVAVSDAISHSGRALQTVAVPLLSKTAVCDIVLGTLGEVRARVAMQDPEFRWQLMRAGGHPRTLRNLLLPRLYDKHTVQYRADVFSVDRQAVARIQLRVPIDRFQGDALVRSGIAAELPSPSRPVHGTLPAAPGMLALRLHIPAAFLDGVTGVQELGFYELSNAVDNLRRSPSGENFEVVVAASLAARIRCLVAAGESIVGLADLFGDGVAFGSDYIASSPDAGSAPYDRDEGPAAALAGLYNLVGCEAIKLRQVHGTVDAAVREHPHGWPAVLYSGQQGVTGAIDVAVVFADGRLLMVQCKMSEATKVGTLERAVIAAEQKKATVAANRLRPGVCVPLVIVSQYPCTEDTLSALQGHVAVVDRRALRHFIPRSYAGLVRGAFGSCSLRIMCSFRSRVCRPDRSESQLGPFRRAGPHVYRGGCWPHHRSSKDRVLAQRRRLCAMGLRSRSPLLPE